MKQLYIKKKNGRYEPYKEPVADDTYYMRRGNKYIPIGKTVPNDFLSEGVWIVSRHKYGRSITSEQYVRDLYRLTKASETKEVTAAEIGGLEKLSDHLCKRFKEIDWTQSRSDICRQIVGILYDYKQQAEK